ncbi:hypothetical protein [Saccharospirillum alexandrii]|uniref:hypothetical protein n=1 Tax=Saccharospirillum alexandrii TaxID=2448477 RepID=UPI003735E23D
MTDWIAVGISSAALLVSVISGYFSLFHKKNRLVAVIAAWQLDKDPKVNHIRCEVSLANNGNLDLLVRAVEIEYEEKSESDILPELEVDEIPAVLKASELMLLPLELPKRFLNMATKMDLRLALSIHIYTLEGNLMLAKKLLNPVTVDNPPIEPDWQPFVMHKVEK